MLTFAGAEKTDARKGQIGFKYQMGWPLVDKLPNLRGSQDTTHSLA